MRWLIVVVVLAGCRTSPDPRLVEWDGDARQLTMTVPLCQMCAQPNDDQQKKADVFARSRCGGDYRIVKEGSRASTDSQAYANPLPGGGVAAGSQAFVDYFWIVRCR